MDNEAGVLRTGGVEVEGPDGPVEVVQALDGGVYREVVTVRAGEVAVVDVPFRVELRPAELAGPRVRS